MSEKQRVFRFAPSPNGELHLGHAYCALLNKKLARACEGKLLLRIENIDTARCTPELEHQMLKDLEWIGFEWDEPPRRQSDHFEDYRDALEILKQKNLVYPSLLSRKEIRDMIAGAQSAGTNWPRDPDGVPLYPGKERTLSATRKETIITGEQPYSFRLDMAKALSQYDQKLAWFENDQGWITANPRSWGDVILARKDTPASYHLCCVIDDHLQGVTDVVRGKDIHAATSIHVLLQDIFGFSQPSYLHHDLIVDDRGEKLSKSERPAGLRALRESGMSAQDLQAHLFREPVSG